MLEHTATLNSKLCQTTVHVYHANNRHISKTTTKTPTRDTYLSEAFSDIISFSVPDTGWQSRELSLCSVAGRLLKNSVTLADPPFTRFPFHTIVVFSEYNFDMSYKQNIIIRTIIFDLAICKVRNSRNGLDITVEI